MKGSQALTRRSVGRAIPIVAGVLALTVAAPAALGAYAPGPFPGPAPGGSFRAVLTSTTFCATGGTIYKLADGILIKVTVPASDLPGCQQFALYAADEALLLKDVPKGQHYLFAFAIAWTPASTAPHALTFTVFDPKFPAHLWVYKFTGTGVRGVLPGRSGKYWVHVPLWAHVGVLFSTS